MLWEEGANATCGHDSIHLRRPAATHVEITCRDAVVGSVEAQMPRGKNKGKVVRRLGAYRAERDAMKLRGQLFTL